MMKVNKNAIIPIFLLMLLLHVAHVFEEVWGRFWIMNAIYGLGWFLVANWVLLCIPVVIFYFYLQHQHWALIMSLVYAGAMMINGLGHILATLVTGKYFDGYAGGYIGAGLVLVGLLLMYNLFKELRTKEE
jgi:hypothetical protein